MKRFAAIALFLGFECDLDRLPWVGTPLHIGRVSHVHDPLPDWVQPHLQQFTVCSFRDHIL
jgi:hypothetical protein